MWCENPGVQFAATDKKGTFKVTVAKDAVPGPCLVRFYDVNGTAPPRVFRRGGGRDADLRGMHGYPATVEDMAAFLVAVGPDFQEGKVIPEAHQLDVYPVAATLLDLEVPDNIGSDGGPLRAILRAP